LEIKNKINEQHCVDRELVSVIWRQIFEPLFSRVVVWFVSRATTVQRKFKLFCEKIIIISVFCRRIHTTDEVYLSSSVVE